MKRRGKLLAWLCGASVCVGAAALLAGAGRPDDKETKGDPYSLKTCPISGKELGAKAVVKAYDGREVRFCCDQCPAAFEKDKAAAWKKIDEAMIKDQAPHYPGICPTCDHKLSEGYAFIYNNRLVRVFSESEKADFLKDPKKYMAVLDQATVKAQKATYPTEICFVSNEKLGSMGEPPDVVIASRLIRLCCKGCMKDLRKEPAKYVAKVDEARKEGKKGGG